MPLFVETNEEAVKANEERRGNYEALPEGEYEATVAKAEVIDYSNKPNWAGKKALNVQLRLTDDNAVGKGRVFFQRVPLFQSSPNLRSEKNKTGVAYGYFSFFEAIGLSKDAIDSGKLPDIKEFLGTRVSVKLRTKPADAYNDAPYSEVHYVNKSKGAPAGTAVKAEDPWAPSAPADDPWGSNEITLPEGVKTF